jgi:potassium efflux system protein
MNGGGRLWPRLSPLGAVSRRPASMLQRLKGLLDFRVLILSGGVVTVGSILLGLAIALASIVVANVLARWLRGALRARGIPLGTQFAAAKIVSYAVIAIGMMVASNSMGLRLDALIATSAVVAVGIGFGLQNIAQNFISGVILLIEQPVRKGDFVRVGDALGVVDDIGLRATTIVTRDEVTILVPNSKLVVEPVINHSRPSTKLRVRVTVGVAYGSDTARVRDELVAVAKASRGILETPAPEVRFEGFGDSSLDFALLAWIPEPQTDLRACSDLRFAIDAAFRRVGIEIPFPQRELHLIRRPAPWPRSSSEVAGSTQERARAKREQPSRLFRHACLHCPVAGAAESAE